jgi:Xaa-Pro dipeptidase
MQASLAVPDLISKPQPLPDGEQAGRIVRFREAMAAAGADGIVLTSRTNFEYLTNHHSLTWAYHSRPLFAVLTPEDFVVVASRAEARNLSQHPRLFRSVFYDGFQAEAVHALEELIGEKYPSGRATIAIDYGQDIFGRGSLELIDVLRARSPTSRVAEGAPIVWRVRMIKTPYEASLKAQSLAIVNRAFDETCAEVTEGVTEREMQRRIQARIILSGAERADPIAMMFSRGNPIYSRPPSDRPLMRGDYVWTDFRSTYGGYPADRNRIARCGPPEQWEIETYERVRALTISLCRSIRPGQTGRDIYRHFEMLWADADLGPIYAAASRIGHGGGLDVTEPPSIAPWSDDIIRSGMILHLEPKLERDGAIFQFEEVVYVRDDKVKLLSALSPSCCPVIALRP